MIILFLPFYIHVDVVCHSDFTLNKGNFARLKPPYHSKITVPSTMQYYHSVLLYLIHNVWQLFNLPVRHTHSVVFDGSDGVMWSHRWRVHFLVCECVCVNSSVIIQSWPAAALLIEFSLKASSRATWGMLML